MKKPTYPKNLGAWGVPTAFITALAPLLYQFLFNRSLWLDEAMLSLNIMARDFRSLLLPLEYSQVAPPAFLLIEKTMTILFGNGEWALRLFPLIASVLSLGLAYKLFTALGGTRTVGILVLLLLAVSPNFVYYATEVKQYASDITVLLLIYGAWFVHTPWTQKYRTAILAAAGGLGIFLSNVAVIPLTVIALLMAFDRVKEKRATMRFIIPAAVWMACFAVNYFLFIKDHPTRSNMLAYWADYFMPTDPFNGATYRWLKTNLTNTFGELLPAPVHKSIMIFAAVIALTGALHLLQHRKHTVLFVCIMPLLIHLAISAFRLYPFAARLALYQMPLYLFLIANGINYLSGLFRRWKFGPPLVHAATIMAFAIGLFSRLPMQNEEIRPVIMAMNAHVKPGQTLYLYYGCKPAFRYYHKTGRTNTGQMRVVEGNSHADDMRRYVKELDPLTDEVWLLFSHVYPFDGSRGEEKYIIQQLQQRGTMLKKFEAYGSSAYLFRLPD